LGLIAGAVAAGTLVRLIAEAGTALTVLGAGDTTGPATRGIAGTGPDHGVDQSADPDPGNCRFADPFHDRAA
jgi:hypothetical protein